MNSSPRAQDLIILDPGPAKKNIFYFKINFKTPRDLDQGSQKGS
jgi:hypothetical protein